MARNNAYRVDRPNYKARMQANEYRDYLNEKRKETNRLKKIETDNLYNENTFGGNVWRNTKKFAAVALPALVGYGVMKHFNPDSSILKTTGRAMWETAKALPTVGMAALTGVVPYTYLRQMEAENSRRDEAYEQFKHMQNKVLAENNLLNYQAPKSNLPGSVFFPRSDNEYGYRRSGDYSIGAVAADIGKNIVKGAQVTGQAVAKAGTNHKILGSMALGAATVPILENKALNALTGGEVKKLKNETPLRYETQPDQSEHEEVMDLKEQLESIKQCCQDEYDLKLERALDTLSEEDRQKLLDLLGPYEANKAKETPCLDKILAGTFSEDPKVGENAAEYAKIPITPNFGRIPQPKDEVLSDATLDFKTKEEKKNDGVTEKTKTITTSVTKTSSPQTQVSIGAFSECESLTKLLHKDFDDKPAEGSGTSGSSSGSSGDSSKPKQGFLEAVADGLGGEGTSKHIRRAAKAGMVVNGIKGLAEGAKNAVTSKGDAANPTDIN